MNLNNKTSKFHVFTPNTDLDGNVNIIKFGKVNIIPCKSTVYSLSTQLSYTERMTDTYNQYRRVLLMMESRLITINSDKSANYHFNSSCQLLHGIPF